MEELSKKYQKLDPIEHVLKKTGMYLGDINIRSDKMFVYQNNKIINKVIDYSPALYKIFDEILVNSLDQIIRDKTLKNVKVELTDDKITIFNDGVGIDIEIHPLYKIYIPELIFGNLMTSTNYDEKDERITGGTHGLGAKLTNIFSSEFTIKIGDKTRNKVYVQTFRKNLSVIEKPKITDKVLKTGFVEISFIPDFKRFGLNKIDENHQMIFKKRIIDSAGLNPKINFYINNEKINIDSFVDYCQLYYDKHQKYINYSCPNWNIVLMSDYYIDKEALHVSFVNNIHTFKNGKHFDYIMNQIIDLVNNILGTTFLKDSNIKSSVSLFIDCKIVNPTFSSQIKDEMTLTIDKFGSKCILPNSIEKKIKGGEINLIEILKSKIQFQDQVFLQKIKTKKTSVLKDIPKLEDANYAGTNKSNLCTLILTEGDSAKATAIAGISALKNGRDIFGVFPLKGKLLNVRDVSNQQIAQNDEINNIIKIMNLKFGMIYNKDNINELRYGSILLMMDADEDGSHIKGLFINFLHKFFWSLLSIEGFLKVLITPVVKINLKNSNLEFRNLQTFNSWILKNKEQIIKIKYYKGLGTSTSLEAKEYFLNLDKNIMTIIDDYQNKIHPELIKAFSKDFGEQRKEWIRQYNENLQIEFPRKKPVTISEFVNMELINFSNYDNIRSIPHLIDGLKPSQRKVIFSSFKKNLNYEMKVAQFASYVAEQTAYHHGENSLVETIINLAQDFVGSNNINFLLPIGQFGTRLLGGKDHSSARYIFTKLNELTRLIFRTEDDDLIPYQKDDNQLIEPKYFVPIIPTVLLNGIEGIGTGFSTNIPSYNPVDLINFIVNKLNKKQVGTILPWFRDFKGSIIKIDDYNYISCGSYKINNNKLIINELPIKVWLTDYKNILNDIVEKSDFIGKIEDYSSDKDVQLEIKIKDISKINEYDKTKDNYGVSNLMKILKLVKMIKFTNVHLYNKKYIIKKYLNPTQIILEFMEIRLEFYKLRKNNLIDKLKKQLEKNMSVLKFIIDIKNNKLKLFDSSDDEIFSYCEKNKLMKENNKYDYLLNINVGNMTLTKIENLKKHIEKVKKDLKVIEQTSIEQLWINDLNELLNKLKKINHDI